MKNPIDPCPECGVEFNTEEEALRHEKAAHGSLTEDELVAGNKLDRVEHSELPNLEAYDKWGGDQTRRIVKKIPSKKIPRR